MNNRSSLQTLFSIELALITIWTLLLKTLLNYDTGHVQIFASSIVNCFNLGQLTIVYRVVWILYKLC
jgi:hypothetical protein